MYGTLLLTWSKLKTETEGNSVKCDDDDDKLLDMDMVIGDESSLSMVSLDGSGSDSTKLLPLVELFKWKTTVWPLFVRNP